MSYGFSANFTIGTLASYPAIPANSTDPAVSFTLPLSAASLLRFTAASKASAPSYTGPIPTSAQFLSAALASQAAGNSVMIGDYSPGVDLLNIQATLTIRDPVNSGVTISCEPVLTSSGLVFTYDSSSPGPFPTIAGGDVVMNFGGTATTFGGSARISKASPTTIRYKKVVCWGLAPQAVNFAQATTLGHRVAISLPVDLMNKFFTWTRASGEVAPTGRFVSNPAGIGAGKDFVSQVVEAFSKEFNDMDGVANGLNFSSNALDMAGDLKRDPCVYNKPTDSGLAAGGSATGISTTHYGANDLVMAYLMFKCFGSSSYDPTEIIYNVDDAYNMLTSQQLAEVINASLEAEDALANAAVQPNGKPVPLQLAGDNKGQVDAMFRGFLASDPLRYFLNGVQIPGLFETNFTCPPSDPAVHGNWCLTVGDKLEVPLQLVFRAPVSVMSVQDNIQNPSSATPDSSRTEIIKGEAATFDCTAQKAALANVISIRLQITCAAPSTGNVSGSTSNPADIPLTVAVSSSVVFYSPLNYGRQTAKPMAVAGGVAPYTFSMAVPYGCPSVAQGLAIDAVTGVLSFAPNAANRLVQWGKFVVPITVTDSGVGSAQKTDVKYVNVSIDDGAGASNSSVCISSTAANVGVNTRIDPAAPALNGVRVNPLYANISNNYNFIPYGQSVVYASPDFASSGTDSSSSADAATNKKNITAPLSYDVITFTYVPPAVNSLSATEPAQLPTFTRWSITSVGGRSGASPIPAGITFTAGTAAITPGAAGPPVVQPYASAYMMINLDPAYTPASAGLPTGLTAAPGADYSPGNAAGNKPGEYKFLVTSTDSNGYVQSIPVNIRIATPSPRSAKTALAASGTAGLTYMNGAKLTYSINGRIVGGVSYQTIDTITLVSDVGLDGNSEHKWTDTAVGTVLSPPELELIADTSPNKNKATLNIDATSAAVGVYPYLFSALDASNIVQTIFFTIEIIN